MSEPSPASKIAIKTESRNTASSKTMSPHSEQSEQDTQETHPKLPSRRTFLAAIASTTAGLIAAACGRGDGTPTPAAPSATAPNSPLITPTDTPVAGSSLLAPPPTTTPVPTATSGLSDDVRQLFNLRHQVHLPLVQHGEPVQVAQAEAPPFVPVPPKDPTPTVTPTRRPPTPTPTPDTTPFPPGPPSKLGLHVERNVQEIFQLLTTGGVAVIKTLELDRNLAARIKSLSPRTVLIGRLPDTAQVQLDSLNPLPAAREFVERTLARHTDDFDGWEGYNEPVAGNEEEMRRLAEFEAERTRLLAEQGVRSVIGNFGTGGPDLWMWDIFMPAVREVVQHNGWLGLHEYSAPTIYFDSTREDQGRYPGVQPEDEGWLTLRYRKVYRQKLQPAGLTPRLILTELGVDGFVARERRPGDLSGKGWLDFTDYWVENGYGLWGPGAYIEQLAWYDAAMRQDDYVTGGCIFTIGASNQWLSYEVSGPTAGILEQYLRVHAPG